MLSAVSDKTRSQNTRSPWLNGTARGFNGAVDRRKAKSEKIITKARKKPVDGIQ